MASGTYTWQVHGLRSGTDACLYGPPFQIGCRLLQLHLHTPAAFNRWPEPSALFLRVVSDGGEVPTERLRIHATFEVPKLHFSGGLNVKDSLARWQGGFGPSQSAQFNEVLARFAEDRLTIKVVVEILEVEALNTTVLRWPLGHFKTLRDAAPCEAGFHHRLCRRLEVQAPDIGVLCFRADLNPNIDATGNLHVSFKLERADQSVDNLELAYKICLEEVGYTSSSEPLRGSSRDWSRDSGLAGRATNCPALRKHSGPLTMQLSLTVRRCEAVDMIPVVNMGCKTSQEVVDGSCIWSNSVSSDSRYLLITAAGPLVAGVAEGLLPSAKTAAIDAREDPDQQGHFATVSAGNVDRLRAYLLESGVAEENILTADYSGEAPQPDPRNILQGFLADSQSAAKLVVYFSGHALLEDGAWCLRWLPEGQMHSTDVTIPPHELFEWCAGRQAHLTEVPVEVIVEANASGCWCAAAKEARHRGRVLAACPPWQRAWADGEGSLFTNWLIGSSSAIEKSQPSREAQVPWEYSRSGTAGPMPGLAPPRSSSKEKISGGLSPCDATSLSPTTARSSLTSAQLQLSEGPGSPGLDQSARSSRISETMETLKEQAVS